MRARRINYKDYFYKVVSLYHLHFLLVPPLIRSLILIMLISAFVFIFSIFNVGLDITILGANDFYSYRNQVIILFFIQKLSLFACADCHISLTHDCYILFTGLPCKLLYCHFDVQAITVNLIMSCCFT